MPGKRIDFVRLLPRSRVAKRRPNKYEEREMKPTPTSSSLALCPFPSSRRVSSFRRLHGRFHRLRRIRVGVIDSASASATTFALRHLAPYHGRPLSPSPCLGGTVRVPDRPPPPPRRHLPPPRLPDPPAAAPGTFTSGAAVATPSGASHASPSLTVSLKSIWEGDPSTPPTPTRDLGARPPLRAPPLAISTATLAGLCRPLCSYRIRSLCLSRWRRQLHRLIGILHRDRLRGSGSRRLTQCDADFLLR